MTKSYRIKPQFAYMLNALAVHNHRTLTGQLECAIEAAFAAVGMQLPASATTTGYHVAVGKVMPNPDGINTVYPTNTPSARDVHPQNRMPGAAVTPFEVKNSLDDLDAIDFED